MKKSKIFDILVNKVCEVCEVLQNQTKSTTFVVRGVSHLYKDFGELGYVPSPLFYAVFVTLLSKK